MESSLLLLDRLHTLHNDHFAKVSDLYSEYSQAILERVLQQRTKELNKSKREATLLKVQLRAEIHKLEADLEHSKSETKTLLSSTQKNQQQPNDDSTPSASPSSPNFGDRSMSLISTTTFSSPSPARTGGYNNNNNNFALDESLLLQSPGSTGSYNHNSNNNPLTMSQEDQQAILDMYPLFREHKQDMEALKAQNADLQTSLDDTTRKYAKALNESHMKLEELKEIQKQETEESQALIARREAEVREVREALEDEIDELLENQSKEKEQQQINIRESVVLFDESLTLMMALFEEHQQAVASAYLDELQKCHLHDMLDLDAKHEDEKRQIDEETKSRLQEQENALRKEFEEVTLEEARLQFDQQKMEAVANAIDQTRVEDEEALRKELEKQSVSLRNEFNRDLEELKSTLSSQHQEQVSEYEQTLLQLQENIDLLRVASENAERFEQVIKFERRKFQEEKREWEQVVDQLRSNYESSARALTDSKQNLENKVDAHWEREKNVIRKQKEDLAKVLNERNHYARLVDELRNENALTIRKQKQQQEQELHEAEQRFEEHIQQLQTDHQQILQHQQDESKRQHEALQQQVASLSSANSFQQEVHDSVFTQEHEQRSIIVEERQEEFTTVYNQHQFSCNRQQQIEEVNNLENNHLEEKTRLLDQISQLENEKQKILEEENSMHADRNKSEEENNNEKMKLRSDIEQLQDQLKEHRMKREFDEVIRVFVGQDEVEARLLISEEMNEQFELLKVEKTEKDKECLKQLLQREFEQERERFIQEQVDQQQQQQQQEQEERSPLQSKKKSSSSPPRTTTTRSMINKNSTDEVSIEERMRQLRFEREERAQRDHYKMLELLENIPEDRSRLLSVFRETEKLPGLWQLKAAPILSQQFEVKSLVFDPSTKRIRKIDLSGGKFKGRVYLDCLPSCLEWLDISSNSFSGPLQLDCLPDSIEYLFINQNFFSGPLDLEHLPRSLKVFFAYQNQFSNNSTVTATTKTDDHKDKEENNNNINNNKNNLSLLSLPPNLEDINFNSNHALGGKLIGLDKIDTICPKLKSFNCGSCNFEGPLLLNGFPDDTIERLIFHSNKFSGEIDWALLSSKKNLTHFDCYANKLEGEIRLGDLPHSLTRLYLQNNEFSSFLDLSQLPPNLVHFDASATKLSGSLQLSNRLPKTLSSLSLSNCEFGGFNLELSAEKLPPNLESIDLSKNAFNQRNILTIKNLPPSLKTCNLVSNNFSTAAPIIFGKSRNRSSTNNSTSIVDEANEANEANTSSSSGGVTTVIEHSLTFFDVRWCPNAQFRFVKDDEKEDNADEEDEEEEDDYVPSWARV